jgi:hypothetical protein
MRLLSFFLIVFMSQPLQSAVIPAGTRVDARLESPVQTATSDAGDAIVAVMAEPLLANGKVVVPRGSRLIGRVETIEPASHTVEGRVRLVFRELQFPDGRTVSTWITNSFSASPPRRALRHVLYMGIGGAAGALVGGKAGRTTGIIGGTLIGFIIAGNSDDGKLPDLTLKPGQVLRLQLGEDLKMDW